jgi:TolB-like protein/Flp pilus assembly protein TadD
MESVPERRLAAVVHADVEGYSRLMAADEDATVRGVNALEANVAGVVRQHRGRLVDFSGDSFLAEFPSAVDATSAALAIQRSCEAASVDQPAERRLRLRIGAHVGEVRAEGERIFGDAIHVAARLQAIAEPGGVCISGSLREELSGKLELRTRDLGPQTLKNLTRPVHAFAVSEGAASADEAPSPVPGFAGRPAIAVLAFTPLGGDREQEILGDGIAEDLITRLATCRDFPVIARNSSFAYKGRSVDVKAIGRELGVGYLIEGSVRGAGTRLRITAQLVDTHTGHHVWAERYDRELADVFAIQDEIVAAVLIHVYPEVMRAERGRIAGRDPASLDAWQSIVLARWYIRSWGREDNARAMAIAEDVLRRDPGNPEAVRILGSTWVAAGVNGWLDQFPADRSALVKLARRALEISGETWQTLMALGSSLSIVGEFDEAIATLQRAAELNPSSIEVMIYLANAFVRCDRGAEAIPLLELASRLDPGDSDPHFRDFTFGMACFAVGRLEDAVRYAERGARAHVGHASNLRIWICALAELGRLDEARAVVATLLEIQPAFRISILEQIIPPQLSLLARYKAALRLAGAPE